MISMHRVLRHGLLLGILALLPVNAWTQSPTILISQEPSLEVRGDIQAYPRRLVVELSPGETHTVEVAVQNRLGEAEQVSIHVEDFFAVEHEMSGIQFYGTSSGPYSARSWVKPQASSLWLAHGDQAFVPVKVTVPRGTKPGDYYAATLFQRASDTEAGLVSRVASLLLITVKGESVRKGTVEDFTVQPSFAWSLPVSFSLKYKNEGTVFAAPTGFVEIKNTLGIVVDQLPLKDWFVLRDSIRERDIAWSPAFALGRYTATLKAALPGEEPVPVTVSFWVIPLIPLVIWMVGIFGVALGIQLYLSSYEKPKTSKRKR